MEFTECVCWVQQFAAHFSDAPQLKINPQNKQAVVDVGGFLDPESHDVYEGGKRALSLSSVPFDPKQR